MSHDTLDDTPPRDWAEPEEIPDNAPQPFGNLRGPLTGAFVAFAVVAATYGAAATIYYYPFEAASFLAGCALAWLFERFK